MLNLLPWVLRTVSPSAESGGEHCLPGRSGGPDPLPRAAGLTLSRRNDLKHMLPWNRLKKMFASENINALNNNACFNSST